MKKPPRASRCTLRPYAIARDASRPELPQDFGRTTISLEQDVLQSWLDIWMTERGVTPVIEIPEGREAIDAVRDYNLRHLRLWVPRYREAILIRLDQGNALRQQWASLAEAEVTLVKSASSEGWADFERLTESAAIEWMARSGLWPRDWQMSLDALALSEAERSGFARDEQAARHAAATQRRTIEHSGGVFTVGVDTLGALANEIAGRVAQNASLLATSTRTVSAAPLVIRPLGGGGGGAGGNGGGVPRLSDDERDVIGFFGEAIAFNRLKQRFGSKRVVDESAWRSGYRVDVCGEKGNDGLGYDFEVANGRTHWYFEVKATKSTGPQLRHTIELGSSEIAHAETCKSDKRLRYRILYVMNALHPERAAIFPLPNPRSRAGLSYFGEPETAGVRLVFPLPP